MASKIPAKPHPWGLPEGFSVSGMSCSSFSLCYQGEVVAHFGPGGTAEEAKKAAERYLAERG